jgi:hypothetical protein
MNEIQMLLPSKKIMDEVYGTSHRLDFGNFFLVKFGLSRNGSGDRPDGHF